MLEKGGVRREKNKGMGIRKRDREKEGDNTVE